MDIGLAYYVRVSAMLYAAPAVLSGGAVPPAGAELPGRRSAGAAGVGRPGALRLTWPVAAVLAVATGVAVVIGFAPQLVLDVAGLAPR